LLKKKEEEVVPELYEYIEDEEAFENLTVAE